MPIADDPDKSRGGSGTSPDYVEVAMTVMPKRIIGLKHMLRPGCRFLPMPMSLGWQENPIDDDYPQRLLVQGLQLTDIDSGATRAVNAPWMHALYTMTHEELPSGVMEVRLEEAQFAQVFTWQHLAVLCVLFIQWTFGLWAISHLQFREATFIFLGIALQIMEGYFSWKFPKYQDPRFVANARRYVLHKGMTTTHFLLIFHQPNHRPPTSKKPYINLEDAAVPVPILRQGHRRILETTFRTLLQLGNMGLKLGCVLSQANGFLIPLTLLFGTLASEIIIMIHTPLPAISFIEPLETTARDSSLLDMVTAICQRTGCISVDFVEAALPDRDGTHGDFQWLSRILETGNVLAAGVHPTHQSANSVFTTALRRRTKRKKR